MRTFSSQTRGEGDSLKRKFPWKQDEPKEDCAPWRLEEKREAMGCRLHKMPSLLGLPPYSPLEGAAGTPVSAGQLNCPFPPQLSLQTSSLMQFPPDCKLPEGRHCALFCIDP